MFEQFVDLADSRNKKSFPRVLREDKLGNSRVYWPAQGHKRFMAQALLFVTVGSIKVIGLDNLKEAAEKSKEDLHMVISNHIADLDHPLKRLILYRAGLKDFADRLFFPAGLKMIERWYTAPLMPGENVLFVMTPFDAKNLEDAKAFYPSLSKKQQTIIDRYEQNFVDLTRASGREKHRLEEQGMIMVSYPEATRSRNGFLIEGQEAVTAHYPKKRDDVYAVPMIVRGIEQINPAEKLPRPGRVEVTVIVGKRYPVRDIWVKDNGVPVTRKVAIDRVMARLAVLQAVLWSDQDNEFYRKQLNGYDPNITVEYQYLPRSIDRVLGILKMVGDGRSQTRSIPGKW